MLPQVNKTVLIHWILFTREPKFELGWDWLRRPEADFSWLQTQAALEHSPLDTRFKTYTVDFETQCLSIFVFHFPVLVENLETK